MSSRDRILKKLRGARIPFTDIPPVDNRQHMSAVDDTSPEGLAERFISEAEALGCTVYQPVDDAAAIEQVLRIVGDGAQVNVWQTLPLDGLRDRLQRGGHTVTTGRDPQADVGVTGVYAALAATGSLVVMSAPDTPRSTSLLPDVHIALVRRDQITTDFEDYMASLAADDYAALRATSNMNIITGPSKTADIAQELIKGAHGPRKVHIVLLG